MERDTQALAEEVPARDLDRAHRGDVDSVGRQVPAARHRVPERADPERILADHEALELGERAQHRLGAEAERPLPEPRQALVGLEDDEEPVLPWVPDDDGPEVGDLHGAPVTAPSP
jgi:hypothetical protein